MYIEICQDVIEDAIAKASQKVNDSLDLLQLFAVFSLKGKHIISIPCLKSNKDLVDSLKTIMGASNVWKLRRSEEKSYIMPSIKAAVSVFCIVTYSGKTQQEEKAIVINPSLMKDFESFLETRFVTENLLDAKFFKYLAHFYLRQKLLKGINICFDAIPGGGSTTCDIVRREIVEAKRFCLVVVDSDKKYPDQPEYGDTAKKIKKVEELYPSKTCRVYIMEEVMEIENLIPERIVRDYASDKSSCDMLERDFSFFDMKVGICLKGLYKNEVYDYWKIQLQNEGIDFSQREMAIENTSTRDQYERYIDDNNLTNEIKKGFGSDLLRLVTCNCDIDGKIRFPELENEMYNNIHPYDLTDKQLKEWNAIGGLVFSWCCGMAARSV